MVAALGEAVFRDLLARCRPIEAAELRALSPMLILSPHPDDETLGCGGLLATASDLGLRPRVVYLTDGDASHRGSSYWTRERLGRLRRQEAIAALADLGVPPDDILFLGWRDAAPFPPGSIERDNTVLGLQRWTAFQPPASLWSPWSREGHCDHLAATEVAASLREALDPRPTAFSFVVWGWLLAELAQAESPRSLECAATVEVRTRALARHQSQTTDLISDATEAFTLSREVKAITQRTSEIYLELP